MAEKTEKTKPNITRVMIEDLVGDVKKIKAKLFGKIPEKKAAGIVRAALVQIGRQLDSAKDGVVRVQGLGNFRIRQVAVEKEGKKETARKIVFRAAAPKPKKK